MAEQQVDLDQLQAAIRDQFSEAFPDFQTVEFDRDDEDEGMPTPALLLECGDIEPAPECDGGDGTFPARLRIEARLIMAHTGPDTTRNIRKASAALATWLYQTRFFQGQRSDALDVLCCENDVFAPANEKFKTWRVEFALLVFLGDSAWSNDGTVPTDVRFSWAPKIGTGNERHYKPIEDATP